MLNMLDQNYTKLGNSMNGRGNFFCAAPWATLYYHGNKASVCHASVDKFEMGPREFLDSDYLKNLKKQFINGEVPSNCISCVIKENMSLKSTRQAILGYLDKNKIPLSDFTVETSSKIIRLELRANNLCNFKCRFCNSENSSLIEEEHEIYPILEQYNPNRLKDEKKTYDINLTELKNLALTNLKVLCITGGEPFLIKSYYDYMDFLIEQDVSKNITLEIYTNCSVYNPKFIERMLKFGQVNFVMSLDGVGKSASYIRHGTIWKNVEKNVNIFLKLPINSYYNIAVSAYTLLDLQNIADFLYSLYERNQNIQTKTYSVIYPTALTALVLNERTRKIAISNIDYAIKKLKPTNFDVLTTELIKIKGLLKTEPVNIKNWNEFVKYTSILDKIRSENFEEVFNCKLTES